MQINSHKSTHSGFSNLESLIVILVTITLSFVLVPAMAYRLGWMAPPERDMEIHMRAVTHPGASYVPPNHGNGAQGNDKDSPKSFIEP